MSISSDDLEDYEEKFRNMFNKQNNQKVNENDMWSLIENLTKEIEICREHENTLQKNLKLCLENENADITTKYVALKEICDKSENENMDLSNRLNDLQVQMELDIETQRSEYLRKIAEMEEHYKREIINLRNQIESDRICYETKEKELYNEVQLAQASTAIQCDEIESSLKRQLVDTNSKLRQSQNIIRSLQMDINNLRNQLASQQCTSLQQKLVKSELKYQPLPLTKGNKSCGDSDDVEFVEAPISARNVTPLIFKGISLPKRKHIIPPLKQCSDVSSTKRDKSIQKKRRLYNPEDIDYLEALEENY